MMEELANFVFNRVVHVKDSLGLDLLVPLWVCDTNSYLHFIDVKF